jgi:hypothetical protein
MEGALAQVISVRRRRHLAFPLTLTLEAAATFAPPRRLRDTSLDSSDHLLKMGYGALPQPFDADALRRLRGQRTVELRGLDQNVHGFAKAISKRAVRRVVRPGEDIELRSQQHGCDDRRVKLLGS